MSAVAGVIIVITTIIHFLLSIEVRMV